MVIWSESDKRRLRAQMRRIWGRSERVRAHTTQTPYPSLLQSTTWTETETWHTCNMKWSIPASARACTGTTGKRQGKALAEEICDLEAVFWAPSYTWSWKSTSGSNRNGWMVQAVSHREENGDVLLNVRSLHHSDHYKYGDIRVTSSHGGPSIRYIIQQHGTRDREGGLRISLSAAFRDGIHFLRFYILTFLFFSSTFLMSIEFGVSIYVESLGRPDPHHSNKLNPKHRMCSHWCPCTRRYWNPARLQVGRFKHAPAVPGYGV